MPAPSQPEMRKFGDHAAVRDGIYANSIQAVSNLPPIENTRYRIELSNPTFSGSGTVSNTDHKAALLQGRTLARRLTADVRLIDKPTGAVADARRMTVASVPVLTNQGSFVLDGNSTILAHQARLNPGAYVRRKGSGEVSTHFAFLPGQGVPHQVVLDSETGVFRHHIGQAEIPSIVMLRALGATDADFDAAWGKSLADANRKAERPHHLDKFWERLGAAGPPPDDAAKQLAARVSKYPMDPWITQRTLGAPHQTYGKEPLLAATRKMLDVFNRRAEPDDRDSPTFSSVWGPEHLIPERISRAGPYLSKLLWQATNIGSLKRVQPGFLSPAIRSVFTSSGLGQSAEGVAAAEYVDHGARLTKVGEGGIGRSAESAPMSARHVSPGQFPWIDPVRTSESENVGLDLRTAFGVRLGADRQLYAPVVDVRTNKIVYKSPRDVADKNLAFPGAFHSNDPMVPAVSKGKLTHVPRHEVDYLVPSMEQSFSPLTNLVPLKSTMKPHRASMGSRMITQALPIVGAEAPYVRSEVPGQPGRSFDELFGRHMGAVFARHDAPGQVVAITSNAVTVKYADGKTETYDLYDNHPSGRKTGVHNEATVKIGDQVAPGQLLAKSNYTDNKGHAAYGLNLRTAWMLDPNAYEDSMVLSRSAADRMRSDHLYTHYVQNEPDVIFGKQAHVSAFPGRHSLGVLKSIDDDGVVKKGTVVGFGDPLIMAVRRKAGVYGRLSRSGKTNLSDASETWEAHEPGVVTDVMRTPHGPTVVVKTSKVAQNGDKAAGRYGNKGVIVIKPDHEMPLDAQGRPLEAILSSLSVVSRVNPAQIFEAHLGKIAEKTGRPYVIGDFAPNQSLGDFVRAEGEKHGVPFQEDLTDPKTGRKIPGVGVGLAYIMKLHHIAASKAKGRGLGGYDESGQPLRGQSGAAMRASLGDTHALLSYGATKTIHDIHNYLGQDNSEFWAAFMAGYPPVKPTVSRPFQRFLTELRAAGINPIRENGRYHLTGLSDADVREMAGDREVLNGETLDLSRDGKPIEGGLHDPNIFGTSDSQNVWGKITLHEPVVSPIYEEPTRRLLGLTEKQFRDTIAGSHTLPNGQTGMGALVHALRNYDVTKELAKAREQYASSRKTVRDEAARKLGYLKALDATKKTPADWTISALPVMPPGYRPVSPGRGGKAAVVSDVNLLYKDAIEANGALRDLASVAGNVGAERLNLYDAVKAVQGIGDPIGAKNRERGVRGVLDRLLGETSKGSFVQQKLLGTPINLSGRGQVLPNADFDMDQIGIPHSVAWEIYHPFVVRRLVRNGMGRVEAVKQTTDKSRAALQALQDEMEARPIRATRYPVLHRYGTIGFRPVLVAGDAIQTNHLVNKALGLDHNGDSTLTQLTTVLVNGKLFLGSFEEFVRQHVVNDYREDEAVKVFGKQTTVFGFKPEADIRVPAVMYDGSTGWFPVTQISIHTSHGPDCYRVETDSGLSSIFTAHHNFLKLSPTCELVPAYTHEIAVGDLLPSLLSEQVPVEYANYMGTPLDYDTGVWFGHWLGDGSLTGVEDTVSQASYELELLEYLERVGKKISTVRPWYEGNRHSIRWTDKELYKRIENDCGRLQPVRRLAGWMLAAPIEFRRGLFVGFLLAEGYARERITVCESTSQLLLLGFKMLLATLGVASRVRAAKPERMEKGTLCKPTWTLNVRTHAIRDLDLEWPTSNPEGKAAQFRDIHVPETRRDGHWDVVPFPALVSRAVLASRRQLVGPRGAIYRAVHGVTQKAPGSRAVKEYAERGSCPRLIAQQLIETAGLAELQDPAVQNWIRLVEAKHLIWEPITVVEKVERPDVTYDFSVAGAETFCVDGFFLTHNTMTVSVPLSEDAKKEVYEKLLPSKNLFAPSTFKATTFLPNMEDVARLHYATSADDGNAPVEFQTLADARRALQEGHIKLSTRVRILENPPT